MNFVRNGLFRQFSWLIVGRFVGALLQAVIIVWLARDAGPSNFGLFSVVYGLAAVAQSLLDFGISAFIIRERARRMTSIWLPKALKMYDYMAIVLFFIIAGVIILAALLFDPFYWTIIPLAIWAAAERNADAWLGIPLADGDVRINTINLTTRRLLALLLYAFLGYVVGLDPMLTFSLAVAVASIVSLIVVRSVVARRISSKSAKISYSRLLKFGWPFWLNTMGAQIRNLDSLLVTSISGSNQAGLYSASSRVTGPLLMISSTLATVLLPSSTRRNRESNIRLIKWCLVFLSGLGVMYFFIILLTPSIIEIILGNDYRGAIIPMQIILGGLVFSSAASIFTATLQGAGRQMVVARVSMAMSFLCLILVALGAFLWGAVGAALGMAATYFIHSLSLTFGIYRWSLSVESKSRLSNSA